MPEPTTLPKRQRALPTLTQVGKRQVISSGRWNDIVIADYIIANGASRSIEIGELAKTAWGHNNNDTKIKVRRYLHKVKTLLIDRGHLLITEYDPRRHRAMSVKLFDGSSAADRQRLDLELKRMRHRGEISIERYERALILLGEQK